MSFSPALPKAKQIAIERMGVSHLNKVWLVFEHPFWDTSIEIFENMSPSSKKISVAYYTKRVHPNHYALLLFMGGEFSRKFESLEKSKQIEELQSIMGEFFGCSIPEPIWSLVTSWSSDPYSYGSYSSIAYSMYFQKCYFTS